MRILQTSLFGAVMISAIVILRCAALYRLPKRAFVALWAAALLRLLLPWTPPSAFSIYSLTAKLTPAAPWAEGIIDTPPTYDPTDEFLTAPAAGSSTAPSAASPSASSRLTVDPWTVIWLTGVLGCGVFFATAYLKCRGQFRMSLPAEHAFIRLWSAKNRLRRPIQVRQSDRIASPLTYGVLRPVILLPKATDWSDEDALEYVLTHEYMHIRRLDALMKPLLAITVCLHWFNPFVWLMYTLANRDIELSCDEAVIRQFGYGAKSFYAATLIRMEEQKSGFRPFCSSFSKNAIEERITAIMKIKRMTMPALLAAAGAVISVTAVFATSAAELPADGAQSPKFETDPCDSPTESREGTEENVIPGGDAYKPAADDIATATELLSAYAPFGLTYQIDPVTCQLDMSWQGKAVHSLYDPTLELWIANSMRGLYLGPDAVDLEAVYESGEITGLRESRLPHGSEVIPEDTEETSEGTPVPNMFDKYVSFGITYEETRTAEGTERNLYYNGKPVNRFVDNNPDGSMFTFGSSTQSENGIEVHALYERGRLIGVAELAICY